MLEKVSRMALLQDFYAGLLTEKQRRMFELYYDDNFSLGEIAEAYGVSRQAVHDLIRRVEKLLESYEMRMGLVHKFLEDQRKIREVLDWLNTQTIHGETAEIIERVTQLLHELIEVEEIN